MASLFSDGTLNPTGDPTGFGAATGSKFGNIFASGNLYRNTKNPIAGNGSDTTDDILDGFVLPANAFDAANRQLLLNFNGKLGATGNNKQIKVWLNPNMSGQTVTNGVISGGTVTGAGSGVKLFDSGTQTGNAVGFQIDVILAKIGTNTQFSIASSMFSTTHAGSTVPVFPTQTDTASMNIVVTGASGTTGAANDVILNQTQIMAMN